MRDAKKNSFAFLCGRKPTKTPHESRMMVRREVCGLTRREKKHANLRQALMGTDFLIPPISDLFDLLFPYFDWVKYVSLIRAGDESAKNSEIRYWI